MATIQSSLVFQDKMSSAITNISNALESASINSKLTKSSLDELERAQKEWKTTLDAANSSTTKNEENIKKIEMEYKKATEAVDKATLKYLKYEDQVVKNTNKLESLKKSQQGVNTVLGITFGSILGNLATQAINSLKSSIDMAIESASDLVEVQNVVDTAFGGSSEVVNEWSKTALNSYGLNELTAKRFAGTMGAMLKSSGLTGDSVASMSTKIAGLAGDMASFYNLDPSEAFMKLRSGISGETEPLKQLGINMSVANIEAYALSQGLKTKYKDMSQAAQMTLRYQYLLQATADAQGDFAKTQNTYANQQKLANENIKRLSSSIATLFLPALTMGYQLMNAVVGFMADNLNTIIPLVSGALIIITTGLVALKWEAIATFTTMKIKAIESALATAGAWAVAFAPLLIGIGIITAVSVALNAMGLTFGEQARNLVTSFFMIGNVIQNIGIIVANFFRSIINGIINTINLVRKLKGEAPLEKKQYTELKSVYFDAVDSTDKVFNGGSTLAKGMGIDPDLLTSSSNGKALKTQNQGKVEIKEEDIKLLHDIATRDYVVNYQQLTPQVTLQGMTINELVDANQVVDMIVDGVAEAAESKLQVRT